MTPQERRLVDELFGRLAQLESAPRDPDAERAIAEGLRRAPHALYPLVQTVLVQDEALRRADAKIRELSGEGDDEDARAQGGFLDTLRDALGGRPARTSVPSVRTGMAGDADARFANARAGGAGDARFGGAPAAGAAPGQGGSSFLGTAAATAAGFIGGALLLNSIGSMFGGGSAQAATPFSAAAPGADQNAAHSDLARDAGADHIGDDYDDDLDGDFDGDFGVGDL